MTGTVTGLFTHKSVPVIFEPPCTTQGYTCSRNACRNKYCRWNRYNRELVVELLATSCKFVCSKPGLVFRAFWTPGQWIQDPVTLLVTAKPSHQLNVFVSHH